METFEIRSLTFSYPEQARAALEEMSLTVKQGEFLVLCGPSGCGKSTLLRQLKTVLAPHGRRSGEILFEGRPLDELDQREQSQRIGFVQQSPENQIVTDKVWHELAFGLESLGYDTPTIRRRVAEMASFFGIQTWFYKNVTELSGGQKQLLNLASVMAMQPSVLILDEPTSQLDPIAASDFLNTVRKINLELGTTVLITEHRLEDILPAADRAVVMEGGRILVADVPRRTAGFLWAEHHPMFSAMPAPTRVFYGAQGKGVCPLTVREGRNWLLGAFQTPPEVKALPEAPVAWEERPSALVLKEVWFRYEKNSPDVLRGVSAVVPEGSLFAIVGGNGAGKSTMLKAVCGICKPYRGKIRVFGKKVEAYGGTELFQNCLAMLPQDPKSLFVKKTVREDLEEMCRDREKLEAVARTCEVEALLDSHPYDLSGGEQQRAALAKVLLTEPRLLLLDEPTKGMDGFFKEKLARILEKLKAQGMTVVMVSHDVEFCAQYGDLISMFFDGQILTTAPPRRFFGQNSFYTTAANRMSRCMFQNAVTAEHVVALYRANGGGDGDDT